MLVSLRSLVSVLPSTVRETLQSRLTLAIPCDPLGNGFLSKAAHLAASVAEPAETS